MNKKAVWVVIGVIVIIVIILVATRSSNTSGKEPIKIGAVLPLTGIAADYGEHQKNAIEMAMNEINASGGVSGRPIQVIFEDDATNPTKTVSATQKLISVDKTEAIIGGTWDFLANAMLPVINAQKKIMITPSAAPDTLEVQSPFLFTTFPAIGDSQKATEKFLKLFPGKKVALLVINNAWGKAHLKTYKAALAKTGNTVVKEIILPQFDNNDVQRELSLLKAQKPDIILAALALGDSDVVSRKNVELGINATIFANPSYADGFKNGKVPAQYMKNTYIYLLSPATTAFSDAYQKLYGKFPLNDADSAYDAVYVLKEAIENAGGTYEASAIQEGLKKVRAYHGASGLIDFSSSNFSTNKVSILQMFDGTKFVDVK